MPGVGGAPSPGAAGAAIMSLAYQRVSEGWQSTGFWKRDNPNYADH